jgi:hypothetical protein
LTSNQTRQHGGAVAEIRLDVRSTQRIQSEQVGVGSLSSCSSPVLDYLVQLHREFAGVTEGKVATYIPELAKADSNWFGICLVTATGHVYEVGDSRQPFTIQSISSPSSMASRWRTTDDNTS